MVSYTFSMSPKTDNTEIKNRKTATTVMMKTKDTPAREQKLTLLPARPLSIPDYLLAVSATLSTSFRQAAETSIRHLSS